MKPEKRPLWFELPASPLDPTIIEKPHPAPLKNADPLTPKLLVEARARLAWGRSPESVAAFLVASGVPSRDAQAFLQRAVAERDLEFRKRGLLDILAGAAAIAVVGFLMAAAHATSAVVIPRHPGVFVVLGAGLLGGPALVARGVFRLLHGGEGESEGPS